MTTYTNPGRTMKKLIVGAVLVAIVLGIVFAPWVTVSFAENRAINTFEERWGNAMDGCGIDCKGCGVIRTDKVPFGRKVAIEYACGLLPSDSPEYHQKKQLFVTLLGKVYE